jgi:hypothetical protein
MSKCNDCPPLVVPRRGYTPSRPSCIECVEKHLGAAYVLITESNDIPDKCQFRRFRAIGHMYEAEDESQQWPELHTAIRQARKAYQTVGTMPNWQGLAALTSQVAEARQSTPSNS